MSYTQADILSIQSLLLTVPGYPDSVTIDEAITQLENQGLLRFGASEAETLTITAAQTAYSLGGDDTVIATVDGATVYGGSGSDTFVGPDNGTLTVMDFDLGTDFVTSQSFNPLSAGASLSTEYGTDGTATTVISTATGTDTTSVIRLNGVTHTDYLSSVTVDGVLFGSEGNDSFSLSSGDHSGDLITQGADLVYGNGGDDYINVNSGNDIAYGGTGNDTISGVLGNNTLYGDAGDDILDTGSNASQLYGGDGNDHLKAAMVLGGDHVLTGGAGADVFELRATQGDAQQSASITDFEEGVDSIVIAGTTIDLDDLPTGMMLLATNGGAVLHYSDNGELFIKDLPGPKIIDCVVSGDGGNDYFKGGVADIGGDVVTEGNDVIYGNGGDDYLNAGSGNDLVHGGDGNDNIVGVRGHNTLYGDAGNDRIDSGAFSSVLYGGDGDDILVGAMVFGGGHELTGGDGADTFVFRAIHGTAKQSAVITDFETGVDQIKILDNVVDFANLTPDLSLEATQDGAILHYGDNDFIEIRGYEFAMV